MQCVSADLSLGIGPLAPEGDHGSKRTQRGVNKSRSKTCRFLLFIIIFASFFFFSFLQFCCWHRSAAKPTPLTPTLCALSLPPPRGWSSILRDQERSCGSYTRYSDFSPRADLDLILKGDESRTLFPAVDVVPAVGRL